MDATQDPASGATPTIGLTIPSDVYNQSFSLLTPDGVVFQTSTDDINVVKKLAVQTAIVFATQLGASGVLLLVLLLMTTASKRRSAAFVFNMLALLCNVIRCAIQCVELTGPLLDFVLVIMQIYTIDGIDNAVRMSIAGAVMTTFVFVFIQLALVTQVWVICLATQKLHRAGILGFCGAVSALAIGFRMNLMVINCKNTSHLDNTTLEDQVAQDWAQSTSNIMAIVSICTFSSVFCTKLALAIRSRRNMGLKQFGAMQIIFIMGCQTLSIPVVFAILDYYAIKGAQLGSFVETLVSIFLPLSSMWASTNVNSKSVGMPHDNKGRHRVVPVGHSDYTNPDDYSSKKYLVDSDGTDTLNNRSPTISSSPTKFGTSVESGAGAVKTKRGSYASQHDDVEMQKWTRSIQVDRSYTVSSDPHANVGRAQ